MRMILSAFAFAAAALSGFGASAATPDSIRARGKLVCPVPTAPYPGFSEIGDKGVWRGMDVDICRSVATAMLGAPDKVEFAPISWANRVPALQSGAIDLVVMLTGWTRSRDVKLGLQFSNPYYFGGASLMSPASAKISTAKDLDGATVCAIAGSTITTNVDAYLSGQGVKHEMLPFDKSSDATAAYKSGRCEAIAMFAPGNAVFRANELDASAHTFLSETIGLEPDGIAVRQGDDALLDAANWTIAALVQADILGITSRNVDALVSDPKATPEQKYFLGVTAGVGDGFGVDDKWAFRVVKANGNYSEIYDRNLGDGSPYKLPAGKNQPWTRGGLLFSPVFD